MELTLGQLNDMRTWTRDGTIEAICGPNNWVAILDLAEQALRMKAALSPERAREIAMNVAAFQPTQGEALRAYAKLLEWTAEPAGQEALRPIEVGCTVRHKTGRWGGRIVQTLVFGETPMAKCHNFSKYYPLSQLERVEPADSGSKG